MRERRRGSTVRTLDESRRKEELIPSFLDYRQLKMTRATKVRYNRDFRRVKSSSENIIIGLLFHSGSLQFLKSVPVCRPSSRS